MYCSSLCRSRFESGVRVAPPRLAAILIWLGLLPACSEQSEWVEQQRAVDSSHAAHAKAVRSRMSTEQPHGRTPHIVHDEHGDFLAGSVPSLGQEAVRII